MRKLILAGLGAYALRWVQKWRRGRSADGRDAATAESLRRQTRPDRRAAAPAGYTGIERRTKQT